MKASINVLRIITIICIFHANTSFSQVEKTFPTTGIFQLVDSLGNEFHGNFYSSVKVSENLFRVFDGTNEIQAFKIVDVLQFTYFVRQHYDSDGENPSGDRTHMFINFDQLSPDLYKVKLTRANKSEFIYLRKQ